MRTQGPSASARRTVRWRRAVAFLVALAIAGPLAAPAHALHAPHRPAESRASGEAAAQAPATVWGCPMCETVRRPRPGTCPICGMALVPMGPGRPAATGARPLMPGLPAWIFFTAALLVLVLSFVLVAVRGRAPRPGPRLDVLRLPGLRRLLARPWFPLAVQVPVVLVFAVVVAAGLFGNPAPDRNLAPALTWTVWWASLVFVVLFFGKLWCTVCPWMALADWLGRLLPRLDRPWPRALRNIWPATILFVFLTWLELGYGVTEKPWLTATLGLSMVALATATLVVFERKAFCRYACLVGRVSGLYATFASSELRAADHDVCRRCATKDCYRGNDRGAPCPTHEFLGSMRENTYCILCMECVKSCPEGNVAWNLRPWGADLLESIRPRQDEACLAVILLSMSAFHGLTMTLTWDRLVQGIAGATGVGWLAAFSVGMAVMLLLPLAAYWLICVLMTWCAGDRRHGVGTVFVRFAYSLLPIALFYHLAHNLQHVLSEGKKVVRLASDPFGWGWNLFGTAHVPVTAMLPLEVGWGMQVALVVAGHVFAIVIAHRTARALYGNQRAATASQFPLLVAMLLFSFQSLWLLSQPMLMRTAM
jgi:hypothetical protein